MIMLNINDQYSMLIKTSAMKKLFIIMVLTAFAAWGFTAIAQSRQSGIVINGKVTSFEESLPLEGASIIVKGSANITGTQADGTFTLLLAPADSMLVISLDGYEPKEIKTSAKNKQYDIVLKRNGKFLTLNSNDRHDGLPSLQQSYCSYNNRQETAVTW
jgi:hypothetical protein